MSDISWDTPGERQSDPGVQEGRPCQGQGASTATPPRSASLSRMKQLGSVSLRGGPPAGLKRARWSPAPINLRPGTTVFECRSARRHTGSSARAELSRDRSEQRPEPLCGGEKLMPRTTQGRPVQPQGHYPVRSRPRKVADERCKSEWRSFLGPSSELRRQPGATSWGGRAEAAQGKGQEGRK